MNFKKLTLAAALGAAVLAPAMAQSGVQVYGRLYPYLVDEEGSGATGTGVSLSTIASTNAPNGVNRLDNTRGMESGNSRIGFRGVEDLGGGVKARFQAEGVVDVDSGEGFSFNRDTFIGLDGGFGSLKLGNLDTVFKNYGDRIGILGLSSGTFLSSSNILRKPGFGTNNASRFHERRPNSIQYEMPALAGFRVAAQYSIGSSGQPAEPPTDALIRQRTISAAASYSKGPVYIALAHEVHLDFFGGSRNVRSGVRNDVNADESRDHATQLTFEFQINKQHKVGLDVIRKEYNEKGPLAGRFDAYDNLAYQVAMENRWTDTFRTAAHVVRSNAGNCTLRGASCNTDGLEGMKYTVGARYDFSRRTGVFAGLSLVKNGKSAQYGSREFGNNPNPGEDIRHVAVGVVHSF